MGKNHRSVVCLVSGFECANQALREESKRPTRFLMMIFTANMSRHRRLCRRGHEDVCQEGRLASGKEYT